MNKRFKNIFGVFKETAKNYSKDDTWVLGAALSYYTIFSLAPVLIIVIALAGMIFGQEAASGQIYSELSNVVGSKGAIQLQEIVANAYKPKESFIATMIAIGVLIFGATTVFYQLQSALNKIWGVKPEPKRGWFLYIKDRVLSFGLIVVIGFLLLVSLVINAAMIALSGWLTSFFPESSVYLFQVINLLLSLGIITLLFATIYKYLPDAIVRWRDVWVGAAFTSFLFMIGHFLISLYLGKSDIASTYGAAGSIVLILVWVSYSSQILFFGAEFTFVYAKQYGVAIIPAPYARRYRLVAVEQNDHESSVAFEEKTHIAEKKLKKKPEEIHPDSLKFKESNTEFPNVKNTETDNLTDESNSPY